MNKKSAVIIVAANFLGASALAGTMGSVTVQPAWTWVGSFSAGPQIQRSLVFSAHYYCVIDHARDIQLHKR